MGGNSGAGPGSYGTGGTLGCLYGNCRKWIFFGLGDRVRFNINIE